MSVSAMAQVVKLGEYEEKRITGEKLSYVVQTAPVSMTEDIIDLMTVYFLPREPICKATINKDPDSVKSLQDVWREAIAAGTTLIALLLEDGQPGKLIGANVTPIAHKNNSKQEMNLKGKYVNYALKFLTQLANRGNIYENYGVEKYMTGYGLTVHADFHGYRIGQRILECRKPLCKLLGVRATGTVFTATNSQKLARKVGFEVLAEEVYSEYVANNTKPFEDVEGKAVMMGLKF